MRIGGMIALVAGAVMIASPALAECFGHTKTVQTKSESTTTVQSSQPVVKSAVKKEG
jgi:hypothetical protein